MDNPRLTQKYVSAVKIAETVLEAQLIARLTHSELYFALVTRGYRWNGREWEKPADNAGGSETLIRIMGEIASVEDATLDICAALVARGYRIVHKSAPHKNAHENEIRQYLTVAKGSGKNGR